MSCNCNNKSYNLYKNSGFFSVGSREQLAAIQFELLREYGLQPDLKDLPKWNEIYQNLK